MGKTGEDLLRKSAVCNKTFIPIDGETAIKHYTLHAGCGKFCVFFNGMQGGPMLQQQLSDNGFGVTPPACLVQGRRAPGIHGIGISPGRERSLEHGHIFTINRLEQLFIGFYLILIGRITGCERILERGKFGHGYRFRKHGAHKERKRREGGVVRFWYAAKLQSVYSILHEKSQDSDASFFLIFSLREQRHFLNLCQGLYRNRRMRIQHRLRCLGLA